jgi:hypothetical protein
MLTPAAQFISSLTAGIDSIKNPKSIKITEKLCNSRLMHCAEINVYSKNKGHKK